MVRATEGHKRNMVEIKSQETPLESFVLGCENALGNLFAKEPHKESKLTLNQFKAATPIEKQPDQEEKSVLKD